MFFHVQYVYIFREHCLCTNMVSLENANPTVYQQSRKRDVTAQELDDDIVDEIDSREIFDILYCWFLLLEHLPSDLLELGSVCFIIHAKLRRRQHWHLTGFEGSRENLKTNVGHTVKLVDSISFLLCFFCVQHCMHDSKYAINFNTVFIMIIKTINVFWGGGGDTPYSKFMPVLSVEKM